MKIYRAYKTELDPNNKQRTALLQHAGAARFAYNWGLRKKLLAYAETGKSPSAVDLHRELNRLKKIPKEDGGIPWMYDISKCAAQEALRNLDTAYKNFFRRCKKNATRKGFPQFKSRKRGIGSFTLTGSIVVGVTTIRLPRLGTLRLKERDYLPTVDVRILQATVSERAGRWFVAVSVEEQLPDHKPRGRHVVGVDVGSRNLAVTSDGELFRNPRSFRRAERRLRMLQKAVTRKKKGSVNRKKAAARVARCHYKIACIRKDTLHKTSSTIVKSAAVIVLEDLNVAGMMKNRCLSKSVSDAAMGELHRQIEYKAAWHGVQILRADRWFPSSKTCSSCGVVNQQLSLATEEWCCTTCNAIHDRDVNAAINLKKLAGSSSATACCPDSSDVGSVTDVKLLVGQEPNTLEIDG